MRRILEATFFGISIGGVFEVGKSALEYGSQIEHAAAQTRAGEGVTQ